MEKAATVVQVTEIPEWNKKCNFCCKNRKENGQNRSFSFTLTTLTFRLLSYILSAVNKHKTILYAERS